MGQRVAEGLEKWQRGRGKCRATVNAAASVTCYLIPVT